MIGFINKKYTQKSLSSKVFFDSIVTKLIGNKNIGLHQRQDYIDLILKKIHFLNMKKSSNSIFLKTKRLLQFIILQQLNANIANHALSKTFFISFYF
jgi:hypothetical protein